MGKVFRGFVSHFGGEISHIPFSAQKWWGKVAENFYKNRFQRETGVTILWLLLKSRVILLRNKFTHIEAIKARYACLHFLLSQNAEFWIVEYEFFSLPFIFIGKD